GLGIAVDATGNAYVTGVTTSSNFPIVVAFQPTLQGGRDAFVAKVDVTGSSLVYSTFLGGEADDFGFGIALDGGGNAYVAGITPPLSLPTAAAITDPLRAVTDAFVAKLTPAGDALVYSTYLGGTGADVGNGIAVNAVDGAVYVAGSTNSNDF